MTDIGLGISRGTHSRPFRRAADGLSVRRISFRRALFLIALVFADIFAINLAMLVSEASYDKIVYNVVTLEWGNRFIGLLAALLFAGVSYLKFGYNIADYRDTSIHVRRIFGVWNQAFFAAAALGFLVRVIGESSRGAFLTFYIVGLLMLMATRAALVILTTRRTQRGSSLATTAFIVGTTEDITSSRLAAELSGNGVQVTTVCELPDDVIALQVQLERLVQRARAMAPDEIYIAAPWNRSDIIDACATAFMRVPSAIHLRLDSTSPIKRFLSVDEERHIGLSSLRLRAHAIGHFGQMVKRLFDILAASAALIVLGPLLLLVGLAIRVESPGPAFFRQKRNGFNKSTFEIFKFRSMRVDSDVADVRQAQAGDARITRVGHLLRRFNIDELPQLINVLRGEMSLVGPRPHALAHDTAFEREVEMYARRHNVRPGITGWAQVNGYRGETDTPEKIRQRVRHDLHYIDNWSFMMDLWIILLTVFSPTAYSNAR